MAFWSDKTLKEKLGGLITPYHDDCIEGNAYTLSIGGRAYITTDDSSGHKRNLQVGSNGLVIPSGQFALIETRETVKVPTSAMAFISIRAKIKFQGLINVSGFHVDPGYEGKLVFGVFNAGPKRIYLSQNQDIFLIWYADLTGDNERGRQGRGKAEISADMVNKINSPVTSPQTLNDKFERQRTNNAIFQTVGAVLLSVALVLFGVAATSWFSYIDKIHEQNARIVELERKVQALTKNEKPHGQPPGD